jgi:hypothetical protein
MSNEIKKSRKAIHNYTFGCGTTIDLNNYTAKCSATGNDKQFYHSYLANLIETKYDNSFTSFEANYVSREGKPSGDERKAEKLQDRIDRMYNQIKELKNKRSELVSAG